MIKNICIILLVFAGTVCVSPAQELMYPLSSNPQKANSTQGMQTKNLGRLPLELPFSEDFSYSGPYPDRMLWQDNYVFVNQSYAIRPKTRGTATFDAIDQHGKIYPQAEENSYQFSADFLTSHPIRLDSVFAPAPMALAPADSILLTFYYQPQGLGSAPRQRDSLVVEFLHTPGHFKPDPDNEDQEIWIDDLWVSKWRAEGESLESFNKMNDSVFFKRVGIYVTDQQYFRNDFQFRFRNYASFPLTKTPDNFAGNTSIWNIDYITLDYGRTKTDPYYHDIAFAAPAQSALKDYQSMPWSHYITNPQLRNRASFNVAITNLDNIDYNYTYRYFVTDENNNIVRNYSGGTWNIGPYSEMGYQSYQPHANPTLLPNPFGALNPADARRFKINHVVRQGNTGDENTRNDTIVFHQVFDKYFAYDDGTPENGYGLAGFNPKGAVRFVLGHTDFLTSVEFFFNSTLYNQNRNPFTIKIWKNLDPEIVLYQSQVVTVEFEQWLNQFVSYPIDPPLEVSDTIYVGWQQNSVDFLNIGFDNNSDASAHIFYNSHGEWLPTIYKGALMIRPVFGQKVFANVESPDNTSTLKVFPNPVTGNHINIQTSDLTIGTNTIKIFDSNGRLLIELANQVRADVSSLPNGVYLVQIISEHNQQIDYTRFIIAR